MERKPGSSTARLKAAPDTESVGDERAHGRQEVCVCVIGGGASGVLAAVWAVADPLPSTQKCNKERPAGVGVGWLGGGRKKFAVINLGTFKSRKNHKTNKR